MRILQVITPARIAGAERSTLSLCEHQARRGHEVTVATKKGSAIAPLLRETGLSSVELGIGGKLNPLAALRLARLCRRLEADVIHTHLSTAAWHGSLAARLARVPSVAHVRALNTAWAYRRATRTIAISHAVKAHLVAQGMDTERIDVVYSGIDVERYRLPCTRDEARTRLGLSSDEVVAVVIAHLSPKKGHSVFLEALALATASCPRLRAVFVGDGEWKGALAARCSELRLDELVRREGWAADVLPYYAAADIVVLPSTSGEGLPRVLLEGGLLGRAAIGTRLSGIPEIIKHEETGLIVEPGEAAGLATALLRLARDPSERERMGRAAREWVAETFTVDRMIAGTFDSYRRAGAAFDGARD